MQDVGLNLQMKNSNSHKEQKKFLACTQRFNKLT